MAGWKIRSDDWGNDKAYFKDTIDGVLVEAFLYDCDGDAVTWSVQHNGVGYAGGEVRPERRETEQDAWDEAKLRANAVICTKPGFPQIFAMPPWLWNKVATEEILAKVDKVINAADQDLPFVKMYREASMKPLTESEIADAITTL